MKIGTRNVGGVVRPMVACIVTHFTSLQNITFIWDSNEHKYSAMTTTAKKDILPLASGGCMLNRSLLLHLHIQFHEILDTIQYMEKVEKTRFSLK